MSGSSTISNSETKIEAIRLQSSAYGATVPVVHGTARLAGNLVDYGDFTAIAHTTTQEAGGKGGGGVEIKNTTYTYTATVVMAICEGLISGVPHYWVGKRKYSSSEMGPHAQGSAFYFGALFGTQEIWPPLLTMGDGSHAINYSAMAFYAADAYGLGSGASVDNHNFEVVGVGAKELHATQLDCDPARVFRDWLFDTRLGRGLDMGLMGDTITYSDYCKSLGLFLSPALTEQASAADRVNALMQITNSEVVVADRAIHVVPLASEDSSWQAPWGTTYSFTADLAPLFALTADQFLNAGDTPPVQVRRKTPADVYNTVKVQFRNRSNDYATDIAVAKDQANIDIYGVKEAPLINGDWICEADVAHTVARMSLQRYLTQLREYRFELPWNCAEILPTNLLTITDESQGLDQVPVRVQRVSETEMGFQIDAVDFPASSTAAPLYALPVQDAFVHGYADLPGDTAVHAIFEAPPTASATGLQVWAAVGGGAAWGGADMWISLNGVDYKRGATIWGRSRAGTLSGAVSGGIMPVEGMTGKLLGASAEEAAGRVTLCYVGGATPEYLAYENATLVSEGAYQLDGLVRGLYGTSDASAHADGDVFVRCDDALAKSDDLDLALIGRQVYVKFTSFNQFGLQQQELADVTEHVYTITGAYAQPYRNPRNLVRVGQFGLEPLSVTPPGWSGGAVVSVSGQSFSRALRFDQPVSEQSNEISVQHGESLYVSASILRETTSQTVQAGLSFRDAAGAEVSFVHGAEATTGTGTSWASDGQYITVPAGASYAVPTVIFSGVAPHGFAQIAEFVVQRPAMTADIAPGAATDIYLYEDEGVLVTGGVNDSGGQTVYMYLLNSLTLQFDSPATVLVTCTASVRYKNLYWLSADIGGIGYLAVYPFIGSTVLPRLESIFLNRTGNNYEGYGDITFAGSIDVDGPVSLSLQARAARRGPPDEYEIIRVKVRYEVIKR